jgi:hypothetical protein
VSFLFLLRLHDTVKLAIILYLDAILAALDFILGFSSAGSHSTPPPPFWIFGSVVYFALWRPMVTSVRSFPKNFPKYLRLSKHADMTIHWKALEEHFQEIQFSLKKWVNQKTNGAIRKCSSRAFQWMVMFVGFDNLQYFCIFCVPPSVTEVPVSPWRVNKSSVCLIRKSFLYVYESCKKLLSLNRFHSKNNRM